MNNKQSGPMTDERLAAIHAYWEDIYQNYYMPDIMPPPDMLHEAICHIDELHAEVERLRAANGGAA